MRAIHLAVSMLGLAYLLSACTESGQQNVPNQPPSVSLTASPLNGPAPLVVITTATAQDLDGDTLTYLWDVAGQQYQDDASFSFTFNDPGEHRIGVVVSDGEYMSSAVITVAVSEGAPPEEPAPPAPPEEPAPPTNPAPPSGTIESIIVSDFNGFNQGNIYELANGQIWQQTEFYYWYHYAYRPQVLIYSSQGQTKLHVDGIDHDVAVIRIQ